MVFFIVYVTPIIAMIWFGLTIGIIKRVVSRDEKNSAVIQRDTLLASILFGVIVFSFLISIMMSGDF